MTVTLGYALIITLIVLIIVFVIAFVGMCLTWWSSLAISLLISIIILYIVYPPGYILDRSVDWLLLIYALFQLFVAVYLLIYIICMALTDRKRIIITSNQSCKEGLSWWKWY